MASNGSERGSKAGLQFNMRKTRIMMTEELNNFHVDHEETELMCVCLGGGCRNLKKTESQNGNNEGIRNNHLL